MQLLQHKLTITRFKSRGTWYSCKGGNSAGTANDFGSNKTYNALRDITFPDVDVARCCETSRNGTEESQNLVQLPAQGKCEQETRFK